VTKQEAQEARRKIQFFELIHRNMNERISIAELMSELYGVIPQTTALTSVQFSDGALMIQGQSKESTDVNLVQKAMMESALFKDATLQYANRPQRLAMEYTEFKIICRVRAGGEG
jgi:Tfp pilus assembly protein PilN